MVTGDKFRFPWQAELWAEDQPAWTIRGAVATNGATMFALMVHVGPDEPVYYQWREISPALAAVL